MVISNSSNTTLSEELKPKYKVGIPRALYYYKFFPFWHELLSRMGCEIILSPPTNKKILETGSKFASNELCVPIKIYFGHVLWLMANRKDLDYIFVPRYVSLNKYHYFCPKFLALPDTVRNTIKSTIPVLEYEINRKKRSNIESAIILGEKLGVSKDKAVEAYLKAMNKFKQYKQYQLKGELFHDVMHKMYPQYVKKPKLKKHLDGDEDIDKQYPLTILILGHPYNTYDPTINQNIIERIKKYHINVILLEQIPEHAFKQRVQINKKFYNYWNMEEELLQGARYFLMEARDKIDGVIFLISFACGPDSLIQELVMRDFKKMGIPFLDIILDEHSGESGLVTRVESFIDMIRRKKYTHILKKSN
ncbi:MAG: acyl-CoA dehydratase activase-related protein [Promethearchaeota archaeon]